MILYFMYKILVMRKVSLFFPKKEIDRMCQNEQVRKNPCKGIIFTSENQKKPIFYRFLLDMK